MHLYQSIITRILVCVTNDILVQTSIIFSYSSDIIFKFHDMFY